jgi:hypothetical protein
VHNGIAIGTTAAEESGHWPARQPALRGCEPNILTVVVVHVVVFTVEEEYERL